MGGARRKLAFRRVLGRGYWKSQASQAPTSPTSPVRFLPPSILAHQVPNAKKLKRKEQLWEKLAKQGELPRDVRRAQARLLSPPVAKAKPGPQDTVERPFYDLWAKDSECPCCHLCMWSEGCPAGAWITFSRVGFLKVVPFSLSCWALLPSGPHQMF